MENRFRPPSFACSSQGGPGGRDAAAQGRSHTLHDQADHGLAEAHRARLHGWRDEGGRIHRRFL